MLVIVAIITPPAELRPRYDCQPSVKQAKYATMRRLYFQIFFLCIAAWSGPVQAGEAIEYPQFRQVDKAQAKPELSLPSKITLLADEDFAPFSFKSIDGKSAGISIQLALSSCALLKLTCDVKFLPYAALLPGLASKQGDVVVGGPSATSISGQGLRTTRPYYLSFSRFIKRVGVNFAGVDAKSLAGRRLGVVYSSAQEQFLKKNFARSSLIDFDSNATLFETLRTGGIDLAFADSTLSAFWLKGENARGCCEAFGGAFMDRTTITRSLVMVMRPEDSALQSAFDYALDQLQESGSTAKVFQTYLPESPF